MIPGVNRSRDPGKQTFGRRNQPQDPPLLLGRVRSARVIRGTPG
ncbi:hypothetical protein E2C01_095271 [Portunus trituberculatus]|uniref:Uncharacterized protein n=1 Tax=Portunus trituberculatus TaxID=210409 RepID=A0A5B7JPD9_PORTR|nr:hypothetical protein [Portunus trituberculatus]